ncbi:MAG: TatD family hydrolase [Gammaproteobacteria bacterium]|nr:TatD family hydrolase [Gammaproteobacteria bacterium]
MSKRPVPRFNTPLIETHCHLDYLKADTLDNLLAQAANAGIERILTIAVSPDNLAKVNALTLQYPQVYGTQGVHPHEADHYTAAVDAQIRETATRNARIRAIGEIGLDYYYEHSDRAAQRRAFEQQLQIACELDLPVVIHSRDADDDMQHVLKGFEQSLTRRGVIHSFTAGPELADYAIAQGWYLGFNGIATFPKAENVREIVRRTPAEQILLETDAPYLTPVPWRGHENAPAYLPLVAEKIAELKALAVEDFLAIAHASSCRLFFPNA